MLWSSSFISGWRATDSISLPADSIPSSEIAATTGDRSMGRAAPFLMTGGGRSAEVDGRQGGEDKGLQGGDQADLQDEEEEGKREGQGAERRDPEQHREPAAHEEQQ